MLAGAKYTAKCVETLYGELVKKLQDQNEELPVKVEAAIAIQHLMDEQTKCNFH